MLSKVSGNSPKPVLSVDTVDTRLPLSYSTGGRVTVSDPPFPPVGSPPVRPFYGHSLGFVPFFPWVCLDTVFYGSVDFLRGYRFRSFVLVVIYSLPLSYFK